MAKPKKSKKVPSALAAVAQLLDATSARVESISNRLEAAEANRPLYVLRDSTQKSFDNVRTDIQTLLRAVQILGERLSRVESRMSQVESFQSRITGALVDTDI